MAVRPRPAPHMPQLHPADQPQDFSKDFEVELPEVSARPQLKQKETEVHKLAQRQKQVDYGKNTLGYALYSTTILKHKRDRLGAGHIDTPDVYQICSKRSFDGQVKRWRRWLHDWDQQPGEGESAVATVNPYAPEARQSGALGSSPSEPDPYGHMVPEPPLPRGKEPTPPGSGQKRQHHQTYQDAPEHESQSRHKRMTYEADASWSLQSAQEEVPQAVVDPADVADELAYEEEEADAAALEKSIYDDWDDDVIAL